METAGNTRTTFARDEVLCGRFKVLRFIGKGGMGEVYEAVDLELGAHVALKTIRPEISANPETIRRFKNEVQLARKVTHPNVCRIFDVEHHRIPSPEGGGAGTEVAFLTMELLEGETLAQRLRRQGVMSTAEALPLVRQMAEGLAAAHDAGVIHRDFKPSNVILVAPPEPDLPMRAVVTDFGLARGILPSDSTATASGESTESSRPGDGAPIGTFAYMAPEQMHGGQLTPATDIYALGLVMCEMVTGRNPFFGLPGGATKLTNEPVPSPRAHLPTLDPRWEAAILHCLQIDPAGRFQNARDAVWDLDRETPPEVVPVRSWLRRNARLWYLLGSVAAVTLALVALSLRLLRDRARVPAHPGQIKSLAVLPLENLSGKADQDYFADGMTDELITDLAKISALRVISRTSVMKYKGAHEPVSQVARALNVDAVVEGTVLRSGDQVRISARLIDARTDGRIWGESYERDLRDVLALQSEVATTIADEIRIQVTSQEQARLTAAKQVNPAAYEAYLKGLYEWNKPTERDWKQASLYFEQAAQIDPDYAPAYSGLADYFWASEELSPQEGMPKAKQYALKALELDPDLAEPYTSLGVVGFYADWNWPEAEKNFRRALELDPGDAGAHRMYSTYLSAMGRADAALEESRKAESLDPLSSTGIQAQITVGWVLYYARLYDRALGQCRSVVELEPGSPGAHDCLGLSYLAIKSYERAIAESRKAAQLSHDEPDIAVGLARAYALDGDKASARKILDQCRARASRSYVAPSLFAQIYIALGEKKQGLAWLEKAYTDRDVYVARLKVEPAFDPVRADPAFQDLMRRLDFPP